MRKGLATVPLLLIAGLARGDTAAQAEFDAGRALGAEGRHREACERFAASQRIEPATGTRLNLAACWHRIGRTGSAWLEYARVVEEAEARGQTLRAAFARAQVRALSPLVHRLVVHAPAGAEVRLDGVRVDGEVVIDPGPHLVAVTLADHQPWARELAVDGPGRTTVIEAQPARRVLVASPPPVREERRARRFTWVALGSGALLLGASAYFGARTFAARDAADAHCDAAGRCDPTGLAEMRTARRHATFSTVFGGLGVAAVGAGVALYVLEGRRAYLVPTISADGVGVSFGGGF